MYNSGMELNISEVRQRLLALLDGLPEEGITITRHGQPVARLVPIDARRKGRMVTEALIKGKGDGPGPLCPTTENPYDLFLP
jgi:prevent-host-death family protein